MCWDILLMDWDPAAESLMYICMIQLFAQRFMRLLNIRTFYLDVWFEDTFSKDLSSSLCGAPVSGAQHHWSLIDSFFSKQYRNVSMWRT